MLSDLNILCLFIQGRLSQNFVQVLVRGADGGQILIFHQHSQDPGQSQWLPLSETFDEIIARGLYENKDNPAEFYVEKESFLERGLHVDDLIESLEPIDHEKVSELMRIHPLQLIF